MNEGLTPADEQLVDAWLASGLNRAAFARQQRVPYHHLRAAIRRVERHYPSADETMQVLQFMGMLPARSGMVEVREQHPTAVAPVTVDSGAASARRTEAPALVLRWGSGLELTVDARTGERIARNLLTGSWSC